MNKNSDSSFPITVLWVRSTAGVNFQVMFIERGTLVHPRLRGTNLVTKDRVQPKTSAFSTRDLIRVNYKVVH